MFYDQDDGTKGLVRSIQVLAIATTAVVRGFLAAELVCFSLKVIESTEAREDEYGMNFLPFPHSTIHF